MGGATYSEGGFSSSAAAITAANNIWSIFGPYTPTSSSPRPFGKSVINGFDFDFESGVSNMPAFANRLRSLMDADATRSGTKYLLTAAPQCPYPDYADNPMLAGTVYLDAIWVQFYNNYCGLQSFIVGSSTENNFNFDTWDTWAKTVSLNPNVKVLLGIPGSSTAAGSGYVSGSTLASIISYCKSFSSFGGVMIWDISQVYANYGFLAAVSRDLGVSPFNSSSSTAETTMRTVKMKPTSMATTRKTTSTTTKRITNTTTKETSTTVMKKTSVTTTQKTSITTTKRTSATSSSTSVKTMAGLVSQYNQCAGEGWTGGTVCKSPFICTELSVWYSQCECPGNTFLC